MSLPRDRVVFITGASSGIGRATAEAFIHDGARVAVCARREIKDLDAFALRCDVRRRAEVQAAVDAVAARFGALHVLVNNAGFGLYSRLEETRDEDLEDIFRTNVFGPVYAIQAALPHLAGTRGQIINVTSSLANTSIPYMSAYCMSKHALHALSVSLRVELKPRGIRVIEVAPGLTDTDFQKSARLTKFRKPAAPESRKGWPPERVARAILAASRRGKREVWLTWDAKFFSLMQRYMPRVTDWAVGRWAADIAATRMGPGEEPSGQRP